MKYLLIGGAGDTGKSTTIRRIVKGFLQEKGFNIEHLVDNENIKNKELKEVEEQDKQYKQNIIGNIDADDNDYFCVAVRNETKIIKTKIIISTASDTEEIIDNFKKYYDKYEDNCSFVIAPIRNENDDKRRIFKEAFKKEINFEENLKNYIEIPLAKINNKKKIYDKKEAVAWYLSAVYSLAEHLLQLAPFNIK